MSLSGSVEVDVKVTVWLTVGDDGEYVNEAVGGEADGGGSGVPLQFAEPESLAPEPTNFHSKLLACSVSLSTPYTPPLLPPVPTMNCRGPFASVPLLAFSATGFLYVWLCPTSTTSAPTSYRSCQMSLSAG